MPYANSAKQKTYLAKYRQKNNNINRQAESARKKAWYQANKKRERSKRQARNYQDRHLLAQPIPVAFIDRRAPSGYTVKSLQWENLTPAQALQCFVREENGALRLRSEKQQLQWLKNRPDLRTAKLYSVIRGKIWFNRDAVLSLAELQELTSRLSAE